MAAAQKTREAKSIAGLDRMIRECYDDPIFAPWESFISESKVKLARLHTYYLGVEGTKDLDDKDCEKILTELLTDAVLAAVIALPAGHKVEDFELKMKSVGASPNTAVITLKGQPRIYGVVNYARCTLGSNPPLSDWSVKSVINEIARGINQIFQDQGSKTTPTVEQPSID